MLGAMTDLEQLIASNGARMEGVQAQGFQVVGVVERFQLLMLERILIAVAGEEALTALRLGHEQWVSTLLDETELQIEAHQTKVRRAQLAAMTVDAPATL